MEKIIMPEYQTSCEHCGATYTAKRSTSKYCSPSCRVAHNRSHDHLVNVSIEVAKITAALAQLERMPQHALNENWEAMADLMTRLERFVQTYKRYHGLDDVTLTNDLIARREFQFNQHNKLGDTQKALVAQSEANGIHDLALTLGVRCKRPQMDWEITS
jgi:hypothetical protein